MTFLIKVDIPEDSFKRERHGLAWTTQELNDLDYMWRSTSKSLLDLAVALKRPIAGVVPKLVSLGYLHKSGYEYYMNNDKSKIAEQETQQTTSKEKTDMNAPTIQTKVFISGHDASQISDLEIFRKIAAMEKEIEGLQSVKNQPQKLLKLIVEKKEEIDALVQYVDSRE